MSTHKVVFIVLVAHGVNRLCCKYIYHLKNNWIERKKYIKVHDMSRLKR